MKLRKRFGSLLVALALTVVPVRAFADQAPAAAAADDTASSKADQQTTTKSSAGTEPVKASTRNSTDKTATTINDSPAGSTSQDQTTSQDSSDKTTSANPTLTIDNNVKSDATSGNAEAAKNDGDGAAATGTTTDNATVLNLANASGVSAGDLQTFNCDITQDLQRNITIDPSSLQPVDACTNNNNPGAAPAQGNLQTGASLVDILNNIALTATSGKASSHDNDGNGTATSGDATALANVVNIANSAISAQHSFLGVINVYGNLQGNIQVPQSFVDGLIKNGGTVATSVSTTDIANNLTSSAQSGDANASGNDGSGTATTGDAMTNVTVMNLTGQQVVAKNSLLVFVNVLGKWTGFILPAKGSNTALLGGGLQSAGQQTTTTENSDSNAARITNNISVSAASGDANASDNDGSGTATSGKANAGINLLNITGSDFKLDDWFGALFINVIGRWVGDFAIASATPDASSSTQPVQAVQVFQLDQPTVVIASQPAKAPTTPQTAAAAVNNGDLQLQSARLTAATAPDGEVLGAATNHFQTLPSLPNKPVKFDLVSLVAVIAALTVLLMLATASVRHLAGKRS